MQDTDTLPRTEAQEAAQALTDWAAKAEPGDRFTYLRRDYRCELPPEAVAVIEAACQLIDAGIIAVLHQRADVQPEHVAVYGVASTLGAFDLIAVRLSNNPNQRKRK